MHFMVNHQKEQSVLNTRGDPGKGRGAAMLSYKHRKVAVTFPFYIHPFPFAFPVDTTEHWQGWEGRQ